MIQDITPHKLDNSFALAGVPKAGDRVICFCGGEILTAAGEMLDFPTVEKMPGVDLVYLFSVDDTRFFTAFELPEPPADCAYIPFGSIRERYTAPSHMIFAAYTAKHLADWYADNRFCGRCGAKMRHSESERAMVCACGYTCYPRIMPAVIVGVTRGDEILLTRYRRGFGRNALVAGFTEIGETLEQTVEREVMEETGLRVKNIRYYKSQPWGGANDILVGFFCDAEDGEIHMDENELKSAVWTKRKDVELHPDSFSLTNEMMKAFKEGRENSGTETVYTPRLVICPATDAQLEEMIENEADAELKKAYGEMLSLSRENPEKRLWYTAWQIKKDGEVIGDACFKGMESATAEIGYGVNKEAEGNGYATEAVQGLIGWAFSHGARVIEAETAPDNAASQRVLCKLSFVPTGENGEEGPRFALRKR